MADTMRKHLGGVFLVSLTVFCIGLAAADIITEMFAWDIAVLAASLELFLEGSLVSVRRPLDEGEELIN